MISAPDNSVSYTSANSLPLKLIKNEQFLLDTKDGKIYPLHLQLNPTNRCNLKCSFCSCKNTDKERELSIDEVYKLIDTFSGLGCRAVTITGGGEPLMHDGINKIIRRFKNADISVGLVTNGLLLDRLIEPVKWCRISCCDERKFNSRTATIMEDSVDALFNIDWAFSYVVGENYDPDNLIKYVEFANTHNFTHVRVVSDLIDLDKCVDMQTVKETLNGIDDSLVIYQGRKEYAHGQRNCYLSLLKPVVGADGKVYPCCGVQYARKEQDLDLPESMCMGDDIDRIYKEQSYFDGSKCFRCYYKNYNDVIGTLLSDIQHKEFI